MAREKKTPERLCLGCGAVKPKRELLRIVKSPQGEISADPVGKKPGRGAYVCPSVSCFDAATKRHRFDKAFKETVDAEVLSALRREIFPEGDFHG